MVFCFFILFCIFLLLNSGHTWLSLYARERFKKKWTDSSESHCAQFPTYLAHCPVDFNSSSKILTKGICNKVEIWSCQIYLEDCVHFGNIKEMKLEQTKKLGQRTKEEEMLPYGREGLIYKLGIIHGNRSRLREYEWSDSSLSNHLSYTWMSDPTWFYSF